MNEFTIDERSLMVSSDEYEGVQIIKMSDLNMCDPNQPKAKPEFPYPYSPTTLADIQAVVNDQKNYFLMQASPGKLIANIPGMDKLFGPLNDTLKKALDNATANIDNGAPFGGLGADQLAQIRRLLDGIAANNIDIASNVPAGDLKDMLERAKEGDRANQLGGASGITDKLKEIEDAVKAAEEDKENNDDIGNRVIIEFGDEYSLGSAVEFEWKVQPGDKIDNDTIIANCVINGKEKIVRSIFSQGTVLEVTDSNDKDPQFFHLYKDTCNRHIVIADWLPGTGVAFPDIDYVNDMNAEMQREGELFGLIKDNMLLSALPSILTNRESLSDHAKHYKIIMGTLVEDCPYKPGQKLFGDWVDEEDEEDEEETDDTKFKFPRRMRKRRAKKFKKKMKKMFGGDALKSTNANSEKLTEMGQTLMDARDNLINEIIEKYEEMCNGTKDGTFPKCKYDKTYEDCRFLAQYGAETMEDSLEFGDEYSYTNYYMYLYAQLAEAEGTNAYVDEYRQILDTIIKKRQIFETYSIEQLRDEFNELYWNLTGTEEDDIKDPYSVIISKFAVELADEENFSPDPIIEYFEGIILVDAEDDDDDDEEDDGNNGSAAHYRAAQITNLLLYLYKNSLPPVDQQISAQEAKAKKEAQMKEEERIKELEILDLVKEEAAMLEEFWMKVIEDYRSAKTPQMFIEEMKEMIEENNTYAQWPTPMSVDIADMQHQLYTFVNTDYVNNDNPDNDDNGIFEGEDCSDLDSIIDAAQQLQEIDPDNLDDLIAAYSPGEDEGEDANANNAGVVDDDDDKERQKQPNIRTQAYWVKYFCLATVISILYMGCAIDILPWIQNFPLPCIFLCLGVINIDILGITLVLGIAIRGMWINPIILIVNGTNEYLSYLVALKIAAEKIKEQFQSQIRKLEHLIPNLATVLIQQLETENQVLREQNEELKIYTQVLKGAIVDGKGLWQRCMDELAHPEVDHRQAITRIENLSKAMGSAAKELVTFKKNDQQ